MENKKKAEEDLIQEVGFLRKHISELSDLEAGSRKAVKEWEQRAK